jgi:hypothetical protein
MLDHPHIFARFFATTSGGTRAITANDAKVLRSVEADRSRAWSQASRIGLDCSDFSTAIHRHG